MTIRNLNSVLVHYPLCGTILWPTINPTERGMDPYPPFGAARIARYTAFMLQHGTARFTRGERDRQHAVRFMAQMKGLPHKLGQILATRNDTLHQRYTLLLDRGAPLSHIALMHILRQELGPDSDTIEATLTCVAATSLAQVYRGQCETHGPFALKIQYPYIRDILHADMAHIRRFVRLIGPLLPATSRSDPKALRLLIDNLGDALLSELDYAREVRHLTRLGAALAAQPGLTSPQPIRALCTDR
ncbi:MAG: AarF/UbiB family protein, partial [Myxococcota bacterium]